MARLESASRLRWPRQIMVSMTSLRNRLAEAPSPSSPLRSRYLPRDLEGILEELGKKLTRTVRVPCHLRFADYRPRSNTVPSQRTEKCAIHFSRGLREDL